MTDWTTATPPDTLTLADGARVPHRVGTEVFNYYDHKAGVIERVATHPQAPTTTQHDRDGAAWWVDVRHTDGTRALLDQSRMCSIAYARTRGWLKD